MFFMDHNPIRVAMLTNRKTTNRFRALYSMMPFIMAFSSYRQIFLELIEPFDLPAMYLLKS
jgi:hypothetical protein